jgi:hypothetical protein
MSLARKRRSWQIELPHIGLLPLGTYCFRKAITCGFGRGFVHRGSLHAVDQAALAVRALVPGVHAVEHGVALVDREHRAFDPHGELRVGHDHGDLDDAVAGRAAGRSFPGRSRSGSGRSWAARVGHGGGCASQGKGRRFSPKPTLRTHASHAVSMPLVLFACCPAGLAGWSSSGWPRARCAMWRSTAAQVPAAFAATVTPAGAPARGRLHHGQGPLGLLSTAFGSRRAAGLDAAGRAGCAEHLAAARRVLPAWGHGLPAGAAGAFTLVGALLDLPFELVQHLPAWNSASASTA